MKLGLFNLMTQPDGVTTHRQVLENTRLMVEGAEAAGFDTAWFAEHHFTNYAICPSPLMMAAYAAGFTKRIKLGTAVIVLPFYHILRVIEEIGLLDVQSEGRAVIGLGYGYQQHEFDRFGRNSKDKVEIALEAFDIIDMAFETGWVDFKGKHYDIKNVPLAIRPMHVPDIYVTGLEPVILQRIAKGGYTPYFSYGNMGLAPALDTRKHIDNQYRIAGVDPSTSPLCVNHSVFVTDDRQEALKATEGVREIARIVAAMRSGKIELDGYFVKAPPYKDEPDLETMMGNVAVGDPHHVAEVLVKAVKGLGTTHLGCFMHYPTLTGKQARRSLDRFAAEVVPLMEKALGMPLDRVNADRELERKAA
jgi:alkanesulfonate monooxygenase SsuD/methylene tetrahydromethanopterin reductase-like flavin-dependent oxidoreductase (luciferase family)